MVNQIKVGDSVSTPDGLGIVTELHLREVGVKGMKVHGTYYYHQINKESIIGIETMVAYWKEFEQRHIRLMNKNNLDRLEKNLLVEYTQERKELVEYLINKGYSFDSETLITPFGVRVVV